MHTDVDSRLGDGRTHSASRLYTFCLDMQPYDENDTTGKVYDARLVRRLWAYVRPYRVRVGIALLLLSGEAAAATLPPLLIQRAIDGPLSNGQPAGVLPIFGMYVAAVLAIFVFKYSQVYLMQTVGQNVMVDLRTTIFGHVQRMSLTFYDRQPVGSLITRLTNDVDALNEFLTQGMVSIVADVAVLAGVIVAMLLLDCAPGADQPGGAAAGGDFHGTIAARDAPRVPAGAPASGDHQWLFERAYQRRAGDAAVQPRKAGL